MVENNSSSSGSASDSVMIPGDFIRDLVGMYTTILQGMDLLHSTSLSLPFSEQKLEWRLESQQLLSVLDALRVQISITTDLLPRLEEALRLTEMLYEELPR